MSSQLVSFGRLWWRRLAEPNEACMACMALALLLQPGLAVLLFYCTSALISLVSRVLHFCIQTPRTRQVRGQKIKKKKFKLKPDWIALERAASLCSACRTPPQIHLLPGTMRIISDGPRLVISLVHEGWKKESERDCQWTSFFGRKEKEIHL